MSRQQRIQLRPFVLALLASTCLPLEAIADPSGSAIKVTTNAKASGPEGGDRVLQAPGDIFQGDEIVTDAGGEAQIAFVDNTRFVVGPNSKVTIDDFVFRKNGTAIDVGVSALKGSFRFIGGKSPSTVYSVRTPTAAIGIRGTVFDLRIKDNGETIILWQDGEGWFCVAPVGSTEIPRQPTQCAELTVGDMVVALKQGGFSVVTDPQQRIEIIKNDMKYAYDQVDLGEEFQVTDRPEPGPPPGFDEPHSAYQ